MKWLVTGRQVLFLYKQTKAVSSFSMSVSWRGRELHSVLFLVVFFVNTRSVGLQTGMWSNPAREGSKLLEWSPVPPLVITDDVSFLYDFPHCLMNLWIAQEREHTAQGMKRIYFLGVHASTVWWHLQRRRLSCSVSDLTIHVWNIFLTACSRILVSLGWGYVCLGNL